METRIIALDDPPADLELADRLDTVPFNELNEGEWFVGTAGVLAMKVDGKGAYPLFGRGYVRGAGGDQNVKVTRVRELLIGYRLKE